MKKLFKIVKYILLGIFALVSLGGVLVLGTGVFSSLPDQKETPAGHARNTTHYLTMMDGVKIAVDIWYPEHLSQDKKYPTLIKMTRYWRAYGVTTFGRGLIALGLLGEDLLLDREVNWFTEADYVVVKVDARGSGASLGSREMEWAPKEIRDYGEILTWIAAQPWSNGKVGSVGVSYEGNTAEMIAINDHPALKVVAPLYNDFNPFLGLIQPGGAQNVYLKKWGNMVNMMDQNNLCGVLGLKGFGCWVGRLVASGVKPIEGYEDLLEEAIADHQENKLTADADKDVNFLDDKYSGTDFSAKDFSPFGFKEEIEKSDVPMILHLGWLDAATTEGALTRFATFSNPQHLLIGPFTHGGGSDTDQFKSVTRPVSPSSKEQYSALIDYFDQFLKGEGATLNPHKQITYYTNGADKWSTTEVWPPVGFTDQDFYFGPNNTLVEKFETITPDVDEYNVDFTTTNGERTRWHTNLGGGDVVYNNLDAESPKRLQYTSQALQNTIEITGTVTLSLYVSSDHRDNMFIAYLEDVAPDGTVTYLTEGVIRSDNRKLAAEGSLDYTPIGVAHSYLRKDAFPMVEGEIAEVSFNLLPISAEIKARHKLRLSLVGADKVMFKRWPEEGQPKWNIYRGGVQASKITIPMK